MKYISILLVLFAFGCQSDAGQARVSVEAVPTPAAPAEAPPTALPGVSLYQLNSSWTTQDKDTLVLESFRGDPVIVAMFFGSCRTACPTIISDMKRIYASMDASAQSTTKFVLITFDPKVDTPDALKELETKFELGPHQWVFLHGETGSIREVAAALDVQYREISEGQFSHTNRITLLDANGLTVAKIDGLKQSVEPISIAVNAMFPKP